MARVPKTGRIVDATSGEGIRGRHSHRFRNVLLPAADSSRRAVAATPNTGCSLELMPTGDTGSVPTFGGSAPLLPSLGEKGENGISLPSSPAMRSSATMPHGPTLDDDGWPKFLPPSASDVPPAYSLVLFALVDPIRMYRVDLDLKQTAMYMSAVIRGDSSIPAVEQQRGSSAASDSSSRRCKRASAHNAPIGFRPQHLWGFFGPRAR